MDSNGSKIDFGLGKTPEGKRAIKLTFNLTDGGYAGAWNFLGRTVDVTPYDYLWFQVKATVPGLVRMAIKDDRNVTYVTAFEAPSTEWIEVLLPLTAFVKDRFATPDSEQSKAVLNEQFDEAAFQNLDPYQQFLKESGNSKKKKKKAKKKLLENISTRIGNLDIRHLAVEEVLCGPRNEKWGPDAPIDWSRIRSFCLSPLIMGEGIVWVGPIEAFKRKKGRQKPVATPTPTVTPDTSGPQTLVVEQLPANIYVQFSEGTGIYQVELLDPAGYHFKTLFRQRISYSQDAWVQWDGLDEAGLEAPSGVYQVVLTKDGIYLKKIPLFLKGKNQ